VALRLLTLLAGRNLPKIRQPREPGSSTINEKANRGLRARVVAREMKEAANRDGLTLAFDR
jgi:hypothetical protein